MSTKSARNITEYYESIEKAENGIGNEITLLQLKKILSEHVGPEFEKLSIQPEDKPEYKETITRNGKDIPINASCELEYHAIGGGFVTKKNDKLFLHPLYDKNQDKVIINMFDSELQGAKTMSDTMDKLKETIENIVKERFPESYFRSEISTLGGAHRPSFVGHFALGKDKDAFPNHIIHNDPGHTIFFVNTKQDVNGNITNLELDSNIHGYYDRITSRSDKAGWRDIKKATDIKGIEKNLTRYFDNLKTLSKSYIEFLKPVPQSIKETSTESIIMNNIKETINEITVQNVMAELVKAGLKHEQLNGYASDLYVDKTPESTKIIEAYSSPNQVKQFNDKVTGKPSYEIAFAYQPAWDSKLQTGPEKTAPGLPKICYSKNDETNSPILIVKGHSGYKPAPYIADVAAMNKKLGVSKAQEEAMKVGSMFGWNVPAADPKVLYKEDKPYWEIAFQKITDSQKQNCGDNDKILPEFPALSTTDKKELTDFVDAVTKNYPEAKVEDLTKLCGIASEMRKYNIQSGNGTLSSDKFNSLTDAQELQINNIIKDLPGIKVVMDYDPRGAAIKLELPQGQRNDISGYAVPEIPKNKLTIPTENVHKPTKCQKR